MQQHMVWQLNEGKLAGEQVNQNSTAIKSQQALIVD